MLYKWIASDKRKIQYFGYQAKLSILVYNLFLNYFRLIVFHTKWLRVIKFAVYQENWRMCSFSWYRVQTIKTDWHWQVYREKDAPVDEEFKFNVPDRFKSHKIEKMAEKSYEAISSKFLKWYFPFTTLQGLAWPVP